MDDLKAIYLRYSENLNRLRERQDKYGLDVPLALHNEIEDHNRALELIRQAIDGELSRADLEIELATLLIDHARLQRLTPRRSGLMLAPPLPEHYIPRPELLAELKEALLAGPAAAASNSAIQMMALHGMGGIGKSVLALALCQEPEIQTAFPDGIIWLTLGQTPDLKAKLTDAIIKLGGVIRVNAPTEEFLKDELAALLRERVCLVILDDVWQRTHAATFRVHAPSCRLLLTTRDAAIAEELGAAVQIIPTLSPDQAAKLLDQWAAGNLAGTPFELKKQITQRLGYLPLAIKLAGAQLRRKDAARWLDRFSVSKLKSRRIETPHDSLTATFDLSLDDLDADTRRLYTSLTIFKEDEATPAVAVAKLWQALDDLDEEETADLLEDLAARALLELAPAEETAPTPLVTDRSALTLHDLLRDLMAEELGAAGHHDAHQAILKAYRPTTGSSLEWTSWPTVPDDGYLYDHLAYHLDQISDRDAKAAAELNRLFANDAWLQARVVQSGYAYDGYIGDLMTVWNKAHLTCLQQIEANQPPTAFVDCLRYALIRTSINSLAANCNPDLVARALEIGHWSADRAMSVAAKISNPHWRITMYATLLKTNSLPPRQQAEARQEGLQTALALSDERSRAEALISLLPYLEVETKEQTATTVFQIALNLEYEWDKADILSALIPFLPDALLKQALEATQSLEFEKERLKVLPQLANYFSGEAQAQLRLNALEIIPSLYSASEQARTLASLAPQLHDSHLAQALDIALSLTNDWDLSKALAALAPRVSGALLERALDASLNIKRADQRAKALAAFIPRLHGRAKAQAVTAALEAAYAEEDKRSQAEALTAILPQLSQTAQEETLADALEAAWAISDDRQKGNALAALMPFCSEARLKKILNVIYAIEDYAARASVLTDLVAAERLPTTRHEQTLSVALEAITEYGNRGFKNERYLAKIAQFLPDSLLSQALNSALTIEDEYAQSKALVTLLPRLSPYYRNQIFETIISIKFGWGLAEISRAAAPYLPETLYLRVLEEIVPAIEREEYQAELLVALAPHLPDSCLERATEICLGISAGKDQVQIMIALAPRLPRPLLERVLTAAQAVRSEVARTRALVAIASCLPAPDTEKLLAAGLDMVLAIQFGDDLAKALAAITPHLDHTLQTRVWDHVFKMESERDQAAVLAALAPHLPASRLEQTVDAVLAYEQERSLRHTLSAIAPHLQGDLLERAFYAGVMVEDDFYRGELLIAFAPVLPDSLMELAFDATLTLMNSDQQWQIFDSIVPRLPDPLRQQLTEMTLLTEDESIQAGLFAALTPFLQSPLKAAVLDVTLNFNDDWFLEEVLIALIPYLDGSQLERALDRALMVADDQSRNRILVALAARLDKQQGRSNLANKVESHLKFDDLRALNDALSHFEPTSPWRLILKKAAHPGPLFFQNQNREQLLGFLTKVDLFDPDLAALPEDQAQPIADHIFEICSSWRWM